MKRIFTIIMIGILLVGCAKTDFLIEHDWIHYDTTCIETIYFGKDGHFAYYRDEGNPVNDSDLYDQNSYDSKSKKIHLKPTGDMSIQVLRYKKSRLLLNIDGDIKEFFDSKDKIMNGANPYDLAYDTNNITDGFSSYLAILDRDGSQIITAPANYDGDDPEFKEYELFERLADNVEYYSWTYNVDQSDIESNYSQLTEKEAINIIKNGSAIGFVQYNKSAKITKIVFYSSAIIE
ncbi:hypothetical protein [Holdemanella biformis]|jgi:hypothetical protein|uniref:Lipoprotein n=1 Tax=Holdemanella biformis TaxID=1735 RepID=A0A412J0V0_9FIRM|nr:hypothetical protein [Holdemanella biformis]RGS45957.1 hypothetical protein DWX92_07000 [Holdemanella biformis]